MNYSTRYKRREKFILRDDNTDPIHRVCIGLRWDGSELQVAGPIKLRGIAEQLMKDRVAWEEHLRIESIMTGDRMGKASPKFRVYYHIKNVKTDPARERCWKRLISDLSKNWDLQPVVRFGRLTH
jgi:hypothetical protein